MGEEDAAGGDNERSSPSGPWASCFLLVSGSPFCYRNF